MYEKFSDNCVNILYINIYSDFSQFFIAVGFQNWLNEIKMLCQALWKALTLKKSIFWTEIPKYEQLCLVLFSATPCIWALFNYIELNLKMPVELAAYERREQRGVIGVFLYGSAQSSTIFHESFSRILWKSYLTLMEHIFPTNLEPNLTYLVMVNQRFYFLHSKGRFRRYANSLKFG